MAAAYFGDIADFFEDVVPPTGEIDRAHLGDITEIFEEAADGETELVEIGDFVDEAPPPYTREL
ncbi:hypothetical protein M413DRAFT_449453 [Hebeloma cylindrosporum]|uniref:Uncharacterized protein n=1 Tax=Hebeloma cylindrosporum TaxID=76867 RepID=A0A0C3BX17_HEBCY|nr:hypothetical protein M413DRAFT_449453 [Hebeloma cylindrosporum h7]